MGTLTTDPRWNHALNFWDSVADDVHKLGGSESFIVDQKLKIAEIWALLAIGRELALIQNLAIRHELISRTFK